MKRRIFNILSVVSLVMCVATAVLWVRAYWVADSLAYNNGLHSYSAASVRGRLAFGTVQNRTVPARGYTGWESSPGEQVTLSAGPDGSFLGFDVRFSSSVETLAIGIAFPQWFSLGLTVILPIRWFLRWQRNRLEQRKGLCPKCGYDLRASKERCPECGTEIRTGRSEGESA